jgi:CHAT domain-containing protein
MPHGALNAIPFEALVVGERDGGPMFWADEGPPIAYEPSASVLAWLRARPVGAGGRADLIVLADPLFAASPEARSGTRGKTLAPLPATRKEAAAIADAFRKKRGDSARVTALLGADATEGRLFEATKGPRVLHVATHGLVDETETASFSSLALTVPPAPVPGDDGFLTLADLFQRWRGRLEGTDLVVLSACESTRGRLQRDDGLYALPRGFLYAGARSVVGSLWKVQDESTAFLMETFYLRLLEGDEKDPLAALAAARLATKARYPHPYHWAAFTFTGAPTR